MNEWMNEIEGRLKIYRQGKERDGKKNKVKMQ